MTLEILISKLHCNPETADFMRCSSFDEFEESYHPPEGLSEAVIRERLKLLGLTFDADPLFRAAETARSDEGLSHLFGYLSFYWWNRPECELYRYKLPKFTEVCGENTGALLDLALALDAVEPIRSRFASMKIPDEYALAALERIHGSTESYARFHGGRLGYPESQHHWMRHFVNGELFRIGRLEFMIEEPPLEHCAAIFRRKSDGALIGLCREGWKLAPDGFRLRRGEQETANVITAHLHITEHEISGIPVNPAGFAETGKVLSLPRDEFEAAWTSDDFVPDIHIPFGGGMTPAKCYASFTDAVKFFKCYFQRDVKAFTSVSWIFNPDLCGVLPDSNIAALMREGYLSPFPSGDEDGLSFVFGKTAADWSDFPRESSLQRAFHALREKGKKLKEGGMVIDAHALLHFGEGIYRKEYPELLRSLNDR